MLVLLLPDGVNLTVQVSSLSVMVKTLGPLAGWEGRLFVPGDQLPKFWQGLEVLENTKKLRVQAEVVQMTVKV